MKPPAPSALAGLGAPLVAQLAAARREVERMAPAPRPAALNDFATRYALALGDDPAAVVAVLEAALASPAPLPVRLPVPPRDARGLALVTHATPSRAQRRAQARR